MTWKNKHVFDFNLPIEPSRSEHTKLLMDYEELDGVTGLHVRAGVNGFTNVVIEMEAACAVKFAGELTLHMANVTHDEMSLALAGVYQIAKEEIDIELEREGADLDAEIYLQAQLVRRIIELSIEHFKR